MSNIYNLVKSIITNKVNYAFVTDLDIWALYNDLGLEESVYYVDGQANNIEDVFYNCKDKTLLVYDAYDVGVVNWNKLLVIAKHNPNCHFIRIVPRDCYNSLRISLEASDIIKGVLFL